MLTSIPTMILVTSVILSTQSSKVIGWARNKLSVKYALGIEAQMDG